MELTIRLQAGDSTIGGTVPDNKGHYVIKSIAPGCYKMIIHKLGRRDLKIDSVMVLADSSLVLNLDYPGPCKFMYIKGQKPKCIYGHTDHIIPVIYGYPDQKMMEKAKKAEIHLGGCVISPCHPHFFCTIHNIEL
jgi:hypothetical protein